MLYAETICQAINFLVAGGAQHLRAHGYSPDFLKLIENPNGILRSLLSDASAGDTYVGHHEREAISANGKVGVLKGLYTLESTEDNGVVFAESAIIPDRENCFSKVCTGQFFYCQ